jgi:hypothetical protein
MVNGFVYQAVSQHVTEREEIGLAASPPVLFYLFVV